MNYTGNIYRPPFEARSLLLQVTVGCSHNRCAFCTMYRDVPFRAEPMEQIERDLQEARLFYPHAKRVFLENGDPFVLPAEKLIAIAEKIHQYLPEVQTIAMYASVKNIRSKTDGELKTLRALGINELNIGLESGLDGALHDLQKGYTADEALQELQRLQEAGMDYGANVIFGAAGSARRMENAAATAEIINATQPYLIFTGSIHADPGCPLYEDMQAGRFAENTIGEYLEEEEAFLEALTLRNCYYFGLHPSNIVQLAGQLPSEKEALLRQLRKARTALGDYLESRPRRGAEGAVLL